MADERMDILHQLIRLTAALQVRNELDRESRAREERREVSLLWILRFLVGAVVVLAGVDAGRLLFGA